MLILVDDMGYSDLGAYGGEIDTPHLDRLAHQGIRFRQFYNNAKCTPTRASLLTGRDAHEVGHAFNPPGRGRMRDPGAYQRHFPEHAATIAELLRKAGYRTYMSGKWHLGDEPPNWPRQHGFDRFFGIVSGASSYFELLQEPGRPREMALEDSLWLPPEIGWYATDAYTDYAIERIRDHHARHSSRPFFLYLSYTAPHFPLHALPEAIQRYRGRYDAGWDRLRQDRYARMLKMGVITDRWVLPPRPPEVPAWDEVEEADRDEWLQRIEVYAAMVDRVDQGVGRILRALEETGQAENTLILFLSDNGATAADVEDRGLHDPSVPIGARGSYVAHRERWAYALNTPFRLYKAWIHEGGSTPRSSPIGRAGSRSEASSPTRSATSSTSCPPRSSSQGRPSHRLGTVTTSPRCAGAVLRPSSAGRRCRPGSLCSGPTWEAGGCGMATESWSSTAGGPDTSSFSTCGTTPQKCETSGSFTPTVSLR